MIAHYIALIQENFYLAYLAYVLRWMGLALPGALFLQHVQRRIPNTTLAMVVSQTLLGILVFWLDRIILSGQ